MRGSSAHSMREISPHQGMGLSVQLGASPGLLVPVAEWVWRWLSSGWAFLGGRKLMVVSAMAEGTALCFQWDNALLLSPRGRSFSDVSLLHRRRISTGKSNNQGLPSHALARMDLLYPK